VCLPTRVAMDSKVLTNDVEPGGDLLPGRLERDAAVVAASPARLTLGFATSSGVRVMVALHPRHASSLVNGCQS
jgi:hypothetical protein